MTTAEYDKYMRKARRFWVAGDVLQFGLWIAGLLLFLLLWSTLYVQPQGTGVSSADSGTINTFNELAALLLLLRLLPFLAGGLIAGIILRRTSKALEEKADNHLAMERKNQLQITVKNLILNAADAGDASAQFDMAIRYEKGKDVPQDLEKAKKYYAMAAENGHRDAQFRYAAYHWVEAPEPDYTAARHWYEKAAEQNHGPAANLLGMFYEKGLGVPIDYHKAAEYYLQSGEGSIRGYYDLALLYLDGKGVTQNREKAMEYLQKAADKGFHTD